jgi:hypothetical protein
MSAATATNAPAKEYFRCSRCDTVSAERTCFVFPDRYSKPPRDIRCITCEQRRLRSTTWRNFASALAVIFWPVIFLSADSRMALWSDLSFLPRRGLLDARSPNSNQSARSRPCLRNARNANWREVCSVFANLVLARRTGIFLGHRDLLADGSQAVGWRSVDDFGPVDSKRPRICRSEANYRSGTQPQSNGDYGVRTIRDASPASTPRT